MKRTSVRTTALMAAIITAMMLPDASASAPASDSAKLKEKSTGSKTGRQSRPHDDKIAGRHGSLNAR